METRRAKKRVNEILELFISEQIDLRVLTLPDELDPCDFLIERGADAFRELEKTAIDGFQHALQHFTAGVDLRNDVHGASRAVERLLSVLAKALGCVIFTRATSCTSVRFCRK